MEDNGNKFTILKTKKEYQQKRLQLTDSMLACFCYDNRQINNELLEFLEGIKESFSSTIQIALLEANTIEENFRKDIIDEKPLPYFLICEPQNIDPTTLLVTNYDQFELYTYFEEKDTFYKREFPIMKQNIFTRIKKVLDGSPIVIFIKGTPFKPFCKYSKQFMELIRPLKIRYKSFDIFADDTLRTFLRLYSGWKTYPQIYINGKIIGGVDVLRGLIETNKIQDLIPEECKYETQVRRVKEIISNQVVLFGRVFAYNVREN